MAAVELVNGYKQKKLALSVQKLAERETLRQSDSQSKIINKGYTHQIPKTLFTGQMKFIK